MEIGLKEFNPAPSSVIINDKQYKLKPFALRMYAWVDKEFSSVHEPSGLKVLQSLMIGQDWKCWFKLCYELMEDTSEFKSYEDFEKRTEIRYAPMIAKAITECMGVSQPMIDSAQKEFDELKKKTLMSL